MEPLAQLILETGCTNMENKNLKFAIKYLGVWSEPTVDRDVELPMAQADEDPKRDPKRPRREKRRPGRGLGLGPGRERRKIRKRDPECPYEPGSGPRNRLDTESL